MDRSGTKVAFATVSFLDELKSVLAITRSFESRHIGRCDGLRNKMRRGGIRVYTNIKRKSGEKDARLRERGGRFKWSRRDTPSLRIHTREGVSERIDVTGNIYDIKSKLA